MRMKMRNWMVATATAALGSFALAGTAMADLTTEQAGSIVIVPKVMGTAQRDTLIQITNTGNATAYAHCFYINAAIEGRWIETDFNLVLTKQQPTHWLARSGRMVNIFDAFGSDGAGFDPGLVPPVPTGFQGELRCVQTDESGAPLRANKLIGSATLIRIADGDTSKYNAIAVPGNPDAGIGNSDNVLTFDNTDANEGEYDACPDTLTINTFSSNVTDPVIDDLGDCTNGNCPIATELTLVPCSQDLERLQQGSATVSIETFDEFEIVRSRTINVDCWFNARLSASVFGGVFNRDTLAVHARFNPIAGDGGIIGIGEELRTDSDSESAWAAYNLHTEGNRFDAARNVTGALLSARSCAGGSNAGASCTQNSQCDSGACVNGVLDSMVLPEQP